MPLAMLIVNLVRSMSKSIELRLVLVGVAEGELATKEVRWFVANW